MVDKEVYYKCESCGEEITTSSKEEHESKCTGKKEREEMGEVVLIPCEFCSCQIPFEEYERHIQTHNNRNPRMQGGRYNNPWGRGRSQRPPANIQLFHTPAQMRATPRFQVIGLPLLGEASQYPQTSHESAGRGGVSLRGMEVPPGSYSQNKVIKENEGERNIESKENELYYLKIKEHSIPIFHDQLQLLSPRISTHLSCYNNNYNIPYLNAEVSYELVNLLVITGEVNISEQNVTEAMILTIFETIQHECEIFTKAKGIQGHSVQNEVKKEMLVMGPGRHPINNWLTDYPNLNVTIIINNNEEFRITANNLNTLLMTQYLFYKCCKTISETQKIIGLTIPELVELRNQTQQCAEKDLFYSIFKESYNLLINYITMQKPYGKLTKNSFNIVFAFATRYQIRELLIDCRSYSHMIHLHENIDHEEVYPIYKIDHAYSDDGITVFKERPQRDPRDIIREATEPKVRIKIGEMTTFTFTGSEDREDLIRKSKVFGRGLLQGKNEVFLPCIEHRTTGGLLSLVFSQINNELATDINNLNYYEVFLFAKYFPGIKTILKSFLEQNNSLIEDALNSNLMSKNLWDSFFTPSSHTEELYIFLEINRNGKKLQILKADFIERISLMLIQSIGRNKNNLYFLTIELLFILGKQLEICPYNDFAYPLLKKGIKGICAYLEGKPLTIDKENCPILLAFGHLYKIRHLIELIDEFKAIRKSIKLDKETKAKPKILEEKKEEIKEIKEKNNAHDQIEVRQIDIETKTAKPLFGHENKNEEPSNQSKDIKENSNLVEEIECVLSHIGPKSTVFCNMCQKSVCIDCHLVYFSDEKYIYKKEDLNIEELKEHKEMFMNSLQSTNPLLDDAQNSGFYPLTNVMEKMGGNPTIDPEPIYFVTKGSKQKYLLKILRIYNEEGNGEYALKQIILFKGVEKEKLWEETKLEYEQMENLLGDWGYQYIVVYNYGCNDQAYEILMECFGKPFNKIIFPNFTTEEFQGILYETCSFLSFLHYSQIFHGDIKRDNLLLNEQAYLPKFIDYGISTTFTDQDSLTQLRKSKIDGFKNIKGYTTRMAPPELLQYFYFGQNNTDFEYYLDKMDIYNFGMTLFYMIANISREESSGLDRLKVAIRPDTEHIFLEQIDTYLSKAQLILWDKEFSMKIFELIKCCLKLEPSERPNSHQLCALFQYMHNLSSIQLKGIIDFSYNNENIHNIIELNRLYFDINKILPKHDYFTCLNSCEKYIKLLENIYGNEYRNTKEYARINLILGQCHYTLYQLKESESCLLEGQSIFNKILPKLHPDAELNYFLLGDVYLSSKKLDKAKYMYEKALKIARKLYGQTAHRNLVKIYQKLGIIYYSNPGKYRLENMREYFTKENKNKAKGLQMLEDSISLIKEHPGRVFGGLLAQSYICLGKAYAYGTHFNDIRTEEEMLAKGLNMMLKVTNGASHPIFIDCYKSLSRINKKYGYLEKAEELLLEGLKHHINIFKYQIHNYFPKEFEDLSDEHVKKQTAFTNCIRLMNIVLDTQIKFGYSGKDIASTYQKIGVYYVIMRMENQAEEALNKAAKLFTYIYGNSTSKALGDTYEYLATSKMNLRHNTRYPITPGEIKIVKELYYKSIEQYISLANGEEHLNLAMSYYLLGSVYHLEHRLQMGERLWLQCADQLQIIESKNLQASYGKLYETTNSLRILETSRGIRKVVIIQEDPIRNYQTLCIQCYSMLADLYESKELYSQGALFSFKAYRMWAITQGMSNNKTKCYQDKFFFFFSLLGKEAQNGLFEKLSDLKEAVEICNDNEGIQLILMNKWKTI